jgi:signal transduction histidine kinase
VLFESLALPGCVINLDGDVLAWNAAMATLTDRDTGQAIGAKLNSLGDIPQAMYQKWQTSPEPDRLYVASHAYTLFCSAGPDDIWVLLLQPHRTAYSRDKHENELLQVVLHDVQNPISAVMGYLDLVDNLGPLNERQSHFLSRIRLALREMSELVSRLLDVAWVDSGTPLNPEPLNLAYLVKNLAENHMATAQAQHVELQLDLERVPMVQGEARRLTQVINNLISNAIKYSPEGGQVMLSVRQVGDDVQFMVQDHGLGIPSEYHDRIFQRFFRVPGLAQEIEGNGLGLAISHEIIERHGAQLHFSSMPGQGSRFYFALPAASR